MRTEHDGPLRSGAEQAVLDEDSARSVAGRHGSPRAAIGRGLLFMLVSAVAFGLMPIFAKLAYAGMDFAAGDRVKTLLTVRFSVAALLMWALWLAVGRHGPRRADVKNEGVWRVRRLAPLVAMGALGYVGQSFSYFTALETISASATGLLLYTYPVLVTILAWLLLRERIGLASGIALVVASVGALMVLGIFTALLTGSGLGNIHPVGVGWGLAAAGIYSLYIIAGSRFTKGVSPLFSSAVIITAAAGVYIVWSVATGQLHLAMAPATWGWALAIAVVCTVLAIATFFAGLDLIGPSRSAITSTLEPAVTVAMAALVLQEEISVEQLLGGALILCAVVVLQVRRNEL